MNTRIRELKEQAFNFIAKQNMTYKEYFWENIRHDRTLQDMVDQKFAELIVRDCMTTIATSNESRQTAHYYRNLVAEHFGVDK